MMGEIKYKVALLAFLLALSRRPSGRLGEALGGPNKR
ncbi:MAG: hypothetical protein UY10_C0026G0011 [Microgenomates group bacterium GW2011_GWA2_47_8]|nr:MAG: hypothetical protein UY10_C0026G0011 [Microgenomates group bacterium GW2011_GWA2_47_8]